MPRTQGAIKTTRRKADARTRAWKSMRMLRQFTVGDLEMTADIRYDNARKYVLALVACRVCRLQRAHVNGKFGSVKKYALVKDLGPRAPIVRADRSVFDENSGRVIRPAAECTDDRQERRQELASAAG